jgi:hypothetical protein
MLSNPIQNKEQREEKLDLRNWNDRLRLEKFQVGADIRENVRALEDKRMSRFRWMIMAEVCG